MQHWLSRGTTVRQERETLPAPDRSFPGSFQSANQDRSSRCEWPSRLLFSARSKLCTGQACSDKLQPASKKLSCPFFSFAVSQPPIFAADPLQFSTAWLFQTR